MAAGDPGASGRPVRGPVGLVSKVPRETVTIQCKFLRCKWFKLVSLFLAVVINQSKTELIQ